MRWDHSSEIALEGEVNALAVNLRAKLREERIVRKDPNAAF